jgi:large subunit ribosomal protein L19e
VPKKARWMRRIRAQRELLAELRDAKKIAPGVYRKFYRHAKGGMYRSRAHLLLNLRLAGALAEETKP